MERINFVEKQNGRYAAKLTVGGKMYELPEFTVEEGENPADAFYRDFIERIDIYENALREHYGAESYDIVSLITQKVAKWLSKQKGAEKFAESVKNYLMEFADTDEKEVEDTLKEAFTSLVNSGFWSLTESNKRGIAAVWRDYDGRISVEFKKFDIEKEPYSVHYFVNFLDAVDDQRGSMSEERKNRILDRVITLLDEISTGNLVVCRNWEDYINDLNGFRYAYGDKWSGTSYVMGDVVYYDVLEEREAGRHIIDDNGGYVFIKEEIPEEIYAYVILFPKEPDNPENDIYVAFDDMIFTSRKEAEKYFEKAVKEGRITYKDFYNDFLRQGYSEKEAEELARKEYSKYAGVRKIATHVPPRHVDDTLAVALLSQKYPNAEIEFLHPQDDKEKIEEYRKDPSVILVDVGGDYNPELKNYDHHQSTEVPFSLRLVLKHEFPQYLSVIESDPLLKKELAYFDVRDRYGFKKASEEYPDVKTSLLQETILLNLAREGSEGIKALGKAFTEMLERKLKEREIVENLEVKEINGFKVAFDPIGVRSSEIFNRHKDVDLLIQVNSMNPNHTSVLRNSYSSNTEKINLSRIENASFVHPAGFLAVVPKPYEEVKKEAEKIVEKTAGIERDRGRGMGR
jgi:hypothetical protein